jgi:hypothetical protein
LSRGRYFKWMAHDDIFSPNFIALCLEELQNDDHTVLVFSKMIYVDADGRPLRAQTSNLSILGSTPYSRFCQLTELATESTLLVPIWFDSAQRTAANSFDGHVQRIRPGFAPGDCSSRKFQAGGPGIILQARTSGSLNHEKWLDRQRIGEICQHR